MSDPLRTVAHPLLPSYPTPAVTREAKGQGTSPATARAKGPCARATLYTSRTLLKVKADTVPGKTGGGPKPSRKPTARSKALSLLGVFGGGGGAGGNDIVDVSVKMIAVGAAANGTRLVAAACSARHVILRRASRGSAAVFRSIRLPERVGIGGRLVALELCPNADFLLIATLDGTLYLYSIAAIFQTRTAEPPSEPAEKLKKSKPNPSRVVASLAAMVARAAGPTSESRKDAREQGVQGGRQVHTSRASEVSAVQGAKPKRSSGVPRRTIFITIRTDVGGSPVAACRWWRSESDQNYALVARNDGTLTFINLKSHSRHIVRTRRGITIQTFEVAPLSRKGSAALLKCLDGSYYILPLELPSSDEEASNEWLPQNANGRRFRPIHLKAFSSRASVRVQQYGSVFGRPRWCITAYDAKTRQINLYSVDQLRAAGMEAGVVAVPPKPIFAAYAPSAEYYFVGKHLILCYGDAELTVLSASLAQAASVRKKFQKSQPAPDSMAAATLQELRLNAMRAGASRGCVPWPASATTGDFQTRPGCLIWSDTHVIECNFTESKLVSDLRRRAQDVEEADDMTWWSRVLNLWWVGAAAGIDVRRACGETAESLFSEISERKFPEGSARSRAKLRALGVHALSIASLRERAIKAMSVGGNEALGAFVSLMLGEKKSHAKFNGPGLGGLPAPPTPAPSSRQKRILADIFALGWVHAFTDKRRKNEREGGASADAPDADAICAFATRNQRMSRKRVVSALVGIPKGKNAAFELAHTLEDKQSCLRRMVLTGLFSVSPSELGSLITNDYTRLLFNTAEGGAVFRALPPSQRFQIIKMQICDWRENGRGGGGVAAPATVRQLIGMLLDLVPSLDAHWLTRLVRFCDLKRSATLVNFEVIVNPPLQELFLTGLLRLQQLRYAEAIAAGEREAANDPAFGDEEDDGKDSESVSQAYTNTRGGPAAIFHRGQRSLLWHLRDGFRKFTVPTIVHRALEFENFDAAAVVYECASRWPEAIECRLRSPRTRPRQVLAWLRNRIRKMDFARQQRLLPCVFEYWTMTAAPTEPLEDALNSVFQDVASALGAVLFASDVDAAKMPVLSSQIYSRLVKRGLGLAGGAFTRS